MIEQWFNEDIGSVLARHRYIVVTDARGEGEYLLKYLPDGVRRIDVTDEWSEIEAKYLAESRYAKEKVVFYARKRAEGLTYTQEYVHTAGVLSLDDMDGYVRQKLFKTLGKNTALSREKLLLAAKLSEGKSEKWWQSVADGITEPLNMKEWLLEFVYAPVETRGRMDETVWSVFRTELYRIIEKTPTEQPAETLAGEVVNVMLNSLLDKKIGGLLYEVYQQWADSTERVEALRKQVDNFAIPQSVNPVNAHSDHPFAELDRRVMRMYSDALKHHQATTDIVSYLRARTSSTKAKAFKTTWLKAVLTLATFKAEGLNDVCSYDEMAVFYQKNYAKLDTAMRKIYVGWMNDEETLRPLQEHYSQLNKELLGQWFTLENYKPTQQGIVGRAFADKRRTAVIVCDGLRLEIAESVVNGLNDKSVKIERTSAFAVLPSVTENGMSALFGCEEVTMSAQARFNRVRESYPDVVVMQMEKLNESATARRLVLCYGDIDQVGEKKQMGGLKDIDNYEAELRDKITMLLRIGYEKVVLTTDHGFVITGILDEADKEPRPKGQISKIEERYVRTEYPLPDSGLIEVESKFCESSYQYYARTDKPFVTCGAYGYSHGGFTPQECIIPAYEITKQQGENGLSISIVNKEELKSVAGNYFTAKIAAEKRENDLFAQERKIKVLLYAGTTLVNGNMIYSVKPGETLSLEYELTNGIDKIVIADKSTAVQIDSCEIRKSTARDVDDLF